MNIELKGLNKRFGDFVATDDVDLTIASGELIALLGPSGCGKTTLLRLMAGLEFPDHGAILFDGQDTARIPVRERRVGFVFQHYALFKHMTVAANVAFGLEVQPRKSRPSKAAIAARVTELLELVQLSELAGRYPSQLSGGQRQRVALARALAIEPRVLLLDEPFGALDARVRKDLRRWMRELHRKTGYTTVFVTHDQEEALELADRIVVMNAGRIEQVGPTVDVYERPATPFVFEFLGDANVLSGDDASCLARHGGQRIFVRPHDFALVAESAPGIDAIVTATQRTGPAIRLAAQCVGSATKLELAFAHLDARARGLAPGDQIRVAPQRYEKYRAES